MTRFLLTISLVVTLLGCRQIERISSSRVERIDSVAVQVPIAGHVLDVPVIFSDSILVEDERVRVRVIPINDSGMSTDVEGVSRTGSIKNDKSSIVDVGKKRYRVIAEIKPDTQEVKVAEKTITETKETVKYNRKMPWWGILLIGGLVMLVLVLLVGAKFFRK